MDRKVTEGGKKIKKERGKKRKIIQSDICPYKFPTDFIQSIRWITKGMKRRSGRNPINFVHAIHICNFVFAIQSRRHATRNRFPLDSSNGYVYFSLLSPAPASSTVSSSSPPRRSPTLRFTSDDSQFLFQWLHLQFPWERERERDVSALAPPPYTILSNTFSPLRTRNTFQYLDVSSCSSLVCFFFSNGEMERKLKSMKFYGIPSILFFFFFAFQAISKGSLSVWTVQMASGMDEGLYAITYCVVYCTFYVRKLISSSVDEENIVSLKELLWKQLDTII